MEDFSDYLLYQDYTSVSIYPYIPLDSDAEFVLLRNTTTGKIFSVTGQTSTADACVLFTAARTLLRETNGLFSATNLLSTDKDTLVPLVLRKPEHYDCNLILNEPEFNGLLKHMVRAAEHVEVQSDTKAIMFPITPIDQEKFNTYLKKNKFNYEVITVSASLLKQSKELNIELFTQEHLNAILSNIFVSVPFAINENKKRHFAVLSCYDSTITSRTYDFCEYMIDGEFRRQDESWTYYKVALGEYPDLSLMEKLDGVIIPGAAGSCYTPGTKWLPKLEEFIRHIYKNTKIRYLGLCYGAQVLAQALGGKVERNHRIGYKAATEQITLADGFFELPYVKSHKSFYAKRPKTLCVVKSHGDYIKTLPDEATLLASSETSKVEAFSIGDRFFATQGHPEYSTDFVCSRDSSKKISEASDNDIQEYEELKELRKEMDYKIPEDSFDFRSICTNFLKSIE